MAQSIELAKRLLKRPFDFERDHGYVICSDEDYARNLMWEFKPEDVEEVQRAWMQDVISLYDTGIFAEERRTIFWNWFSRAEARNGCLHSISCALSSQYENELKELGTRLACIDIHGYEWKYFFFADGERGWKLINDACVLQKLESL